MYALTRFADWPKGQVTLEVSKMCAMRESLSLALRRRLFFKVRLIDRGLQRYMIELATHMVGKSR